jgi:hypothetical protein
MGGPSVLSQKDPLEQVSEAHVAQVIAECEKARRRLRLFGFRVVGFLVLLELGFWLYGTMKEPGPAKPARAQAASAPALPPAPAVPPAPVSRGTGKSQGKARDALLAKLRAVPLPPAYIGVWADEDLSRFRTLYRNSDDRIHLMTVDVLDQIPADYALLETRSDGGCRFALLEPDGDSKSIVIGDDGDLYIYSPKGHVSHWQLIKSH